VGNRFDSSVSRTNSKVSYVLDSPVPRVKLVS